MKRRNLIKQSREEVYDIPQRWVCCESGTSLDTKLKWILRPASDELEVAPVTLNQKMCCKWTYVVCCPVTDNQQTDAQQSLGT